MKYLILLLWLFPGLASAESVYRCVGPGGHVSYQSASCPSGQRTDRTIEFVPAPAMAPAFARQPPGSVNRPARNSRHASPKRSGKRVRLQPTPCAQARINREQQLQQLGLKRTYDDLNRIDARVRAVCRGY